MDKKYILTIAISIVFAGLVGFYCGRFYEVSAARKRFMQIRGGNFQQGQRGVRPNGQGNQFDPRQGIQQGGAQQSSPSLTN